VWCSHEYTEANLRWAHHLHQDDPAIKERFEAVLHARAAERPTIPSTIGEELQTNLFVRCHDAEEFARYRHSKDHWRG
jgi:hydroxyacylglutathione hydrolase